MWPFSGLWNSNPSANVIITDVTSGQSSSMSQQQMLQNQQQYLGNMQGYHQQSQLAAQNAQAMNLGVGSIMYYQGQAPQWAYHNPALDLLPYISYEWTSNGQTVVWHLKRGDHGTKMFEIWK